MSYMDKNLQSSRVREALKKPENFVTNVTLGGGLEWVHVTKKP